jgi:hypothetical protein
MVNTGVRRVNLAALVVALALAGCGGSTRPATTGTVPRIPHALGTSLAARADRIALELRSGNGCAAAADAARLSAALDQAAASGALPRRLQAPALTAIGQIRSKIVCRPATTTPTTNTTPAPPSCATLQAQRRQLEQEKQALDQRKKEIDKQYKGKDAAARKHALDVERHKLDQAEHALDQQLKGCH